MARLAVESTAEFGFHGCLMPIKVQCPGATCGAKGRVPEAMAGKAINCPKCQTVIQVPAATTATAIEAAAPAKQSPPAPAPLPPAPAPAPPPEEEEFVDVLPDEEEEFVPVEDADDVLEILTDDELLPVPPDGPPMYPRPQGQFLPQSPPGYMPPAPGAPAFPPQQMIPPQQAMPSAPPQAAMPGFPQMALPYPPQQAGFAPVLAPGDLIPSTPGWHQAALLRPRHLSLRPRKGLDGPDFKIFDIKNRQEVGAGWRKGKRQKGSVLNSMFKAAVGMQEIDVFVREAYDAPVIFSVRMCGNMGVNGCMTLVDQVEIYDELENRAGTIRFDVLKIFEELRAFLIFDAHDRCLARSEMRHVKSQRTRRNVPYVGVIDSYGQELGRLSTEQREVVEEEERQGWLVGAFDATGITARIAKSFNTPSTRVILLSILLTMKLTGVWQSGLEATGR